MLEMQAILIDFLEKFEFSPAPGNPEIIRSATAVMSPMYDFSPDLISGILIRYFRVKGEPGRTQLPLTVTALS